MTWLTVIALFVIGSLVSGGILSLFMVRKVQGIVMIALSVIAYVAYQIIANTYFV